MSPPTSLPFEELVRMVRSLADVEATLPPKLRRALNKEYGLNVQVTKVLGSVHYTVGSGLMPDFRFTLKADGKLSVESYKPGDWEAELKRAYHDLVAQSGAFAGLSIKVPEPTSHVDKAAPPTRERKPHLRIGMQTWGSHGDIRPLLALAEGLQSSGHEVTLAITCIDSTEWNTSISKTGVKIQSVATPVIPDKSEYAAIMEAWTNEANGFKKNDIAMTRLYRPVEAENYQVAEQLCDDNDLVIGHYFHYPLQTAAEKAGRDYVSVMLSHGLVPSSLKSPVGYPMLLGKLLGNRLPWFSLRAAYNKRVKGDPDRLRAAHGLSPAKDVISEVFSSHQLTLIAVSPQICERQRDWADYYQVCGFLDMPSLSTEGELSSGLQEFLSNGDAPVYMTFGTHMPSDLPSQRDMVALLSEAATIANCRAIIQAPLWQECGLKPTLGVYYVHASPYSRSFPRCKAVVHHGGAGTSQAATLAGKPSVVVVFGADQALWGQELGRIGISPHLLFARKVTAEQLAKSIKDVIGSSDMQETAKKIGAAMNGENGVDMAVKLINKRFSV